MADNNSIWNSNSPNLEAFRRLSLRGSHSSSNNSSKSTCSWHTSSDNKYLVGYIVISRQDLDFYNQHGFQLCAGKPTPDGQFGAMVEHVVPGSLVNIICKLKVGDEIVEWNRVSLRNKSNEEVAEIVETSKNAHTLRLVAVRYLLS